MLNRSYGIAALLLGVVLCGAVPEARAVPLTLADLQAGASFDSSDLTLSFGQFSITAVGSIQAPLSDFRVVVLEDGFTIAGPMSAFDGETGAMEIAYRVTAAAELVSAILSFNGSAAGGGSEARASETFGHLGSASVYARDGELRLSDATPLGAAVTELDVLKRIELASGAGGAAVVSEVTQRFEVVPEPASAVLLLLGGTAVFALRRRTG